MIANYTGMKRLPGSSGHSRDSKFEGRVFFRMRKLCGVGGEETKQEELCDSVVQPNASFTLCIKFSFHRSF